MLLRDRHTRPKTTDVRAIAEITKSLKFNEKSFATVAGYARFQPATSWQLVPPI
jgi:hypothetical protein